MEKEWIKRVREESKRRFEELLRKKEQVEGMYEIPKEYADASNLYTNVKGNKMLKNIIKEQNDCYKNVHIKFLSKQVKCYKVFMKVMIII